MPIAEGLSFAYRALFKMVLIQDEGRSLLKPIAD
jgi:hypothetical protein